MNLRERARAQIANQSRSEHALGVVSMICTVFPAIGIAFFIALKTFWFCPEGGCSLESATAKLGLLINGLGVISLIVFFTLLLQFPFLLMARPFCSRKTVEKVYLSFSIQYFEWYDLLIRKWVSLLWRGH
jgi:hypothetical protein